ncbi:copper amine oxidase N-terminal domain-containing protein [Paenibacillus sp. N1-5-1-14]|uniref:copper amine oxidase N-terminal domain-containing protein n=1 Tax=Paenibacillus radicibacter TaxID=2972488 RepID=UPI002159B3EB|nr:copper amine oxidase N-terminal domain-containing protein [Paenibacillus radicibacter]MCR8644323.1 copper amine oxidase N-terminal domain-containing protein [Paenibacillus radicibacter]
MKKFIVGMVCGIAVSFSTVAVASDSIKAYLFPVQFEINGEQVVLDQDYKVLNVDQHTYVPIRFVAEHLGSTVDYDADKQKIYVKNGQEGTILDPASSKLYQSEALKFRLILPSYFEGKYEVVEQTQESLPSASSVHFFNKANKAGFGGLLFTISTRSKESWNADVENGMTGSHQFKVGEKGDQIYVFSTPSDVQYDPANSELKEEYLALSKSLTWIRTSFKLT